MQFFIFLKNRFLKIFSLLFNKKVLKGLICFLSIIFLIFAPNFIFNKKNYELNLNKYLNLEDKEKIVLNLWHIETFEGGTNSRVKFIEKQAINFNKQNNNCFISVTKMDEQQLILNLKQNIIPDMFSFGVGVGYLISGYLTQLENNSNVRTDLIEYSKINNEVYAYPYILSGYCLISHQNLLPNSKEKFDKTFSCKKINKKEIKGLSITSSSFINSSEVLLKQGLKDINKSNILEFSSTYNAYTNFISKKSISLLGTARDVARCKNRELNGSLSSCNYTFLSGYTDLIQYIGANKNLTKIKTNYAKSFSKFLTMSFSQNNLANYGLFSTTNKSIYSNGYMKDFESSLQKQLSSVNVFSSYQQIENNNKNSFNSLFI